MCVACASCLIICWRPFCFVSFVPQQTVTRRNLPQLASGSRLFWSSYPSALSSLSLGQRWTVTCLIATKWSDSTASLPASSITPKNTPPPRIPFKLPLPNSACAFAQMLSRISRTVSSVPKFSLYVNNLWSGFCKTAKPWWTKARECPVFAGTQGEIAALWEGLDKEQVSNLFVCCLLFPTSSEETFNCPPSYFHISRFLIVLRAISNVYAFLADRATFSYTTNNTYLESTIGAIALLQVLRVE